MDTDYDVYPFSHAHLREIQHFMHTNQTAHRCVDIIDGFVFHSVRVRGAAAHFQRYVDQYIVPFLRRVLRVVAMTGWCAYRTRRFTDPSTGERITVPEALLSEYVHAEARVHRKRLTMDMRVMRRDGAEEERIRSGVFVFCDPTALLNEHLVESPMSRLLHEHRYIMQVRRFTLQAESVRSNPTIYLRAEAAGTSARDAAVRTGVMEMPSVHPSSALSAPTDPRARNLELASENMAHNLEFHAEQMRAGMASAADSYYSPEFGTRPQYHNNMFVCPPGTVLAAPVQLPETRVDMSALEAALTRKIYTGFGIPESVAGGSTTMAGRTVNPDPSTIDLLAFQATLDRYRRFFTDCVAVLYGEIFKTPLDVARIEFTEPEAFESFVRHETLYKQGSGRQSD